MGLIHCLETEDFRVKSAIKSIPKEVLLREKTWNLFTRAMHRQAHYTIWINSDVTYYDDTHPIFIGGDESGKQKMSEPREEKSKRKPNLTTFVGFNWKDSNGLAVRKIKFFHRNGREVKEVAGSRAEFPVDLLFDYNGRTVYGNVAFINPKKAGNPELSLPMQNFERIRLYVQRALGRYVDYWAIVNRDYADALPEEVVRKFKTAGNTLVRMNTTMKDYKPFEAAVQKAIKKKTKGRRSGPIPTGGRLL